MGLNNEEMQDLKKAVYILERPGLAAKISNCIGKPIEASMEALPQKAREVLTTATQKAIEKALDVAIFTMDSSDAVDSYPKIHKAAAFISGVTGGAFGLVGLPAELPITTTIMLRSVADIARHEGEDIEDIEAKLACVAVFALGGTSTDDNASETGYFAARTLMAKAVSEAAEHIATHGLNQKGAPALVRFIILVAERFGLQIAPKIVAQAVPIIGAVTGGTINYVFIDHFQDMARGHFTVRRLERAHGELLIRDTYEDVKREMSELH